MKFAVCIPSRGTIHSRTIETVMANVADAERAGHVFCGLVLTHDLPIPDCDEVVAQRGMDSGADALWFVEEDVVPPDHALVVGTPAHVSAWMCVCGVKLVFRGKRAACSACGQKYEKKKDHVRILAPSRAASPL